MTLASSEENLKAALRQSMKMSVEDRLSNLETDTAALRVTTDGLVHETSRQTQILDQQTRTLAEIKESTAGFVDAWKSAQGTWTVVQGISKFTRVIATIVVSVGIFWGAFTHGTKENFVKLLEMLK